MALVGRCKRQNAPLPGEDLTQSLESAGFGVRIGFQGPDDFTKLLAVGLAGFMSRLRDLCARPGGGASV